MKIRLEDLSTKKGIYDAIMRVHDRIDNLEEILSIRRERRYKPYRYKFNLQKIGDFMYVSLRDAKCKSLISLQNSILASLRTQKKKGIILGDYSTKKCENSIKVIKVA